jgi:hypothetical protein
LHAFPNQDHRIELLTLRLVDRHDVYASGIVPVGEQLIPESVRYALVQGTSHHPYLRPVRADSLATIESN